MSQIGSLRSAARKKFDAKVHSLGLVFERKPSQSGQSLFLRYLYNR
jgi:hypothetical protein